jgi:hypothetical protein
VRPPVRTGNDRAPLYEREANHIVALPRGIAFFGAARLQRERREKPMRASRSLRHPARLRIAVTLATPRIRSCRRSRVAGGPSFDMPNSGRTPMTSRPALRLLAGLTAAVFCHSVYAVHFARTETRGSGFDTHDSQPVIASSSGADTSTATFVNDAFARADLHGLLQVQARTSGDTSRFSSQGADAFAELVEVLKFSGPGLVTLTLTVDGKFSNDLHTQPNSAGNGTSQLARATLFADLAGPTALYRHVEQRDATDRLVVDNLCVGDERTCTPSTSGPGFSIESSGTENAWHAVLKRSFLADARHDFTYGVHATLEANVAESGNGRLVDADLAHSAVLSIALAPGMTMTSESGALVEAVPEPAEWMELAAGMFALAAVMRGRRKDRPLITQG